MTAELLKSPRKRIAWNSIGGLPTGLRCFTPNTVDARRRKPSRWISADTGKFVGDFRAQSRGVGHSRRNRFENRRRCPGKDGDRLAGGGGGGFEPCQARERRDCD